MANESTIAKENAITLVSGDGDIRTANKEAMAKYSTTIRHMIEDVDIGPADQIPLPNLDKTTLNMVVDICEAVFAADDIEMNDATDNSKEVINKKRGDLIPAKFELEKLPPDRKIFAPILAANYLDIGFLLDKLCKVTADYIKDLPIEEIRAYFGVVNDFTPEEEEKIRKENEWCDLAK